MRHVVWDWNGTIFDDQPLVLEALNAVLVAAGRAPVDLETFQRVYTRPVQAFYETLLGRSIEAEEWPHLDDIYHQGYRQGLDRMGLAHDARTALDLVAEAGVTQSLLSMYRHDDLVPLVARFDIGERFVRIDGLRGEGGGRKAPFLAAHLERIAATNGHGPDHVVVIGDAIDDAHAAAEVGVACVLYDGGSHPRTKLEACGVPVADSLVDAVAMSGLVG